MFRIGVVFGAVAGFAAIVFLRGISQAEEDVWGSVTAISVDPEAPDLMWIRIAAR